MGTMQEDLTRLTRDTLLDGLDDWDINRVRDLRDACREAETRVSYARRLAQGRLDIALAERDRRGSGGDLLNALPSILADRRTGRPTSDRAVGFIDLTDDDDEPVGEVSIADLPDLTDAELVEAITALTESERLHSEQRRSLLANLDRLQAELVARYREGRAAIDEVIGRDAGPRG